MLKILQKKVFDTVKKKFNITEKYLKPTLNLKFKQEDKLKFDQMKEILREKYSE